MVDCLCKDINRYKRVSRPLHDFPVLFKAHLIFKDYSRNPSEFKYFSSLCQPCICSRCKMQTTFSGQRNGGWIGLKVRASLYRTLVFIFNKDYLKYYSYY